MLTGKYLILYWKTWKRLPENPEYAEMRLNITMTSVIDVRPACGPRAAVRFCTFPGATIQLSFSQGIQSYAKNVVCRLSCISNWPRVVYLVLVTCTLISHG